MDPGGQGLSCSTDSNARAKHEKSDVRNIEPIEPGSCLFRPFKACGWMRNIILCGPQWAANSEQNRSHEQRTATSGQGALQVSRKPRSRGINVNWTWIRPKESQLRFRYSPERTLFTGHSATQKSPSRNCLFMGMLMRLNGRNSFSST